MNVNSEIPVSATPRASLLRFQSATVTYRPMARQSHSMTASAFTRIFNDQARGTAKPMPDHVGNRYSVFGTARSLNMPKTANSPVDMHTDDSAPLPKKSIYNIPVSEFTGLKERAYNEAIAINTEGLTNGEILNRVRAIFEGHLGEDFEEPAVLSGITQNPDRQGTSNCMYHASQWYRFALTYHNVDNWDKQDLKEAKGFVGMSNEEIFSAVRDQYPDIMTLRECLLMSRELQHLGVQENNYQRVAMDSIVSALQSSVSNWREIAIAMLDMPACFEGMKEACYAAPRPCGNLVTVPKHSAKELLDELLYWTGNPGLFSEEIIDALMELLKKNENLLD